MRALLGVIKRQDEKIQELMSKVETLNSKEIDEECIRKVVTEEIQRAKKSQ